MLLDQLKQRIQRTRSAIGNLAHEIKKPLQILSLEVDSKPENNSSQRAVRDIRAIVDRELRRVKISGANVVGGTINLAQEIPYLIEVMNRIYPAIIIESNIRVEPATVNLDRDDLLELLGNLLDNACKFAQKKVVLQIFPAQNILEINIDDDGPGVDIDQLTRIREKGYRLDESVDGHGLGLSICNDIINSYQGDLTFQKSNMDGLKATAIIPLHS